jgi:hypothetical protein
MNFDKVFLAFTFSIALSRLFFLPSFSPSPSSSNAESKYAGFALDPPRDPAGAIDRETDDSVLAGATFFSFGSSFDLQRAKREEKNSLLFNPEPPPSLHKLFQVRASSSSTSSKAAAAPAPTTTSRRNALSSLLLGAAAVGASVLSASPPPASAAVGGVGRTGNLAKGRDARKAAMKAKAEAIREKKVGYSQ